MTPSSSSFEPDPLRDRLADLALGLESGESELDPSGFDSAEREELEELELAAAALYLGFRRDEAATEPQLASTQRERALERFHEMTQRPPQAPTRRPRVERSGGPSRRAAGKPEASPLPWLVAAGALLGLGASLWMGSAKLQEARAAVQVARVEAESALVRARELAPRPVPGYAEAEALGQDDSSWSRISWTPLEDDYLAGHEPGGSVVWNGEDGEGFLLFEDLPANDPTREQYQLWIFDRRLPDATPVDGGVFDVASGAPVVVPIDPKLEVSDAWRFAITLEKPGGVVVSEREHLLLLADA